MKEDNTLYLSVDVEADGPIPGLNNMLSFGVAAFRLTEPDPRKPISTFKRNLKLIREVELGDWPLNHSSEATMDWWKTKPKAWEACREDPIEPWMAMEDFIAWVRGLQVGSTGRAVVVGYPVTYDFMFLYWYTMAFGGLSDGEQCPYGFSGLDIKTLAATKLGRSFKSTYKSNMPKEWFKGAPKHNHEALTDAIGQGILFVNIMLDTRR